jgi:hypothetical protein
MMHPTRPFLNPSRLSVRMRTSQHVFDPCNHMITFECRRAARTLVELSFGYYAKVKDWSFVPRQIVARIRTTDTANIDYPAPYQKLD